MSVKMLGHGETGPEGQSVGGKGACVRVDVCVRACVCVRMCVVISKSNPRLRPEMRVAQVEGGMIFNVFGTPKGHTN